MGFQYSVINERITLPDRTSRNRYSGLDIPLLAGYRLYKNKFEIDANTGVVLNISSAYKGYISSVNNEPLNVHKENVYRNNTSLGYYGSIQFLYHPANRVSLFAEPYLKYQPHNIASSFQPFEERVQKAGVLLGARYRFNK